jgi:hypothetical protein
MTEADIAAARGLELHTWRRTEGAEFRRRIPVVNPDERLRLYDRAQVEAYLAGQPIPARPDTTGTHPDDLLSDREAASVLAITSSTVRAYAASGYLPPGTERHGRTWWTRTEIETRRDAGDQRHHPERTGAGRRPGDPRNRQPRPRHDPRITEVAQELTLAEVGHRPAVTAAELADRYGVSQRTGERLLSRARAENS